MMKQYLKNNRGLTIVEIMTVIVILGIASGVFYSTLVINHDALGTYISRSDMWNDMDVVVDAVSRDGRNARQITLDATNQVATLSDETGAAFAVYTINRDGTLTVARDGGAPEVMTIHAVPGDATMAVGTSFFDLSGKSLVVNLTFAEQLFNRVAQISTSTEVLPR